MTFINSTFNLPEPVKRIYRNIEKNQNKVILNSLSIKFNEIYINSINYMILLKIFKRYSIFDCLNPLENHDLRNFFTNTLSMEHWCFELAQINRS